MTSKPKTFDCVRMKSDIQRKQREELGALPEAERRRVLQERIEADRILGAFLRRVRGAGTHPSS